MDRMGTECGHRDLNPGYKLGKLVSYQARLYPRDSTECEGV